MKNYHNYKNLKVLVTGSTGFKGSWLSFWLRKLGAKVTGVGLKPKKEEKIFNLLNLNKRIDQHFINIKDYRKLNNLVKSQKPDIIFHLAAQSLVSEGYVSPLETFESNIIGSVNILELTKKYNVPSLVFVSSDKCYLNDNKKKSFKENDVLGGFDNYSVSKASAELIFHSYFKSYFDKPKLNVASVRAGNVIGGGDFKKNRIIPDIVKAIKKNKDIFLRNPKAVRPWQHVMDPLSGYLNLGLKLIDGKLNKNLYPSWNFGPSSSKVSNVLKLTKTFLKIWNIKRKIKIEKKKLFKETNYLRVNIKKAKNELKWKPKISFYDSIKLSVDWYKYSKDIKISQKITNEQIEKYY